MIRSSATLAAPAIVCDVCDTDCVAESYFIAGDELDICPACYEKDKEEKYSDAEHQKEGEKWFEPIEKEEPIEKGEEEKPKKKRKTKK
jgi:ribosome-binding protein aMBF1 (putative translation factor)